jgi:hypothetical protein
VILAGQRHRPAPQKAATSRCGYLPDLLAVLGSPSGANTGTPTGHTIGEWRFALRAP